MPNAATIEGEPSRAGIHQLQLEKLRLLSRETARDNPFYREKYSAVGFSGEVASLAEFAGTAPMVTKAEFINNQLTNPPYGTNLTCPLSRYSRCHQTSGSTGAPLRWLDTPESWGAMLDNWQHIFNAAGITAADRLFFAFSFGPFIGFWSAFESAARQGYFSLPGGAMNSEARLQAILDHGCTVLFCTPTYALHLGEAAKAAGVKAGQCKIRLIITAGEPGGCIPGTRARLLSLWPGARVFDHHGMTESGPVTYECPVRPGVLHVLEHSFLAEVIEPATGKPAPRGHLGELVLTTLDRNGSPLIRYRTGDLVKVSKAERCACGRHELAFTGGILGRADDMFIIRGVNVYPGAVDNIVRGFREVSEYRVILATRDSLNEISIEVDTASDTANGPALADRIQRAFQTALTLRVPVKVVPPGSLPHFEMKGRRWIRAVAP